ncbi:leucine-rich repeat domain-containing protein [Polaribacter septentrionalilitoris]|uniref:leucine-rich repeat domain-containing protein n=1 Tax=Polaribacter septentrionalilitoris TaxID=2494657 RepID=UPI001356C8DC|nr:leucine-rich repeat domain-containing protein [Polaribacter septentrionalilitoris]
MKKLSAFIFFYFFIININSQVYDKFIIDSIEYIIEDPYSTENFEVSIRKYQNCPKGKFTIPESIYWNYNNKTYKIVGISENAFKDCVNLNEVVFPNSLKYIGEEAFKNTGLKTLNYPKGLTSIGYGAFRECKNLETISIEEGVTYIGNSTFSWCNSLLNVTISNTVKSFGYSTFSACKSLRSIVIPDSVENIESGLFGGCSNLETVKISDSLKKIPYKTFSGCERLNNVEIPDNIEKIESSTFSGCKSLTSITIPENVKTIGDYAFYNCIKLENVSVEVKTPIIINNTVFKDVAINNIPLKVPENSELLYKNANIWKNFKTIIPLKITNFYNNLRVEFYPNPASKQIKIELNNSELQEVLICNNLGQLIKTSNKTVIDTSKLESGIYFLLVKTNKGKATKKLVIE